MNNKCAIVADSGMDIPKEFKEQYPIFELPFQIIYKDKIYEDRVTIEPHDIYQHLEQEIPTTSLPSGERIHSLLEKLEHEGYKEILVFSISDKISGTHQFIKNIAEDFTQLNFTFFNTKNIGLGAGMFAMQAAMMLDEGYSIAEVQQRVFNKEKSEIFVRVSTLEYLYKGGRISSTQASVGKLLNIQPIITCDEFGNYIVSKKVRNDKQFYKLIDKKIEEAIQHHGKDHLWIAVSDGNDTESLEKLTQHIQEKFGDIIMYTSTVSPAIGVHTGPGLLGLGIYQL